MFSVPRPPPSASVDCNDAFLGSYLTGFSPLWPGLLRIPHSAPPFTFRAFSPYPQLSCAAPRLLRLRPFAFYSELPTSDRLQSPLRLCVELAHTLPTTPPASSSTKPGHNRSCFALSCRCFAAFFLASLSSSSGIGFLSFFPLSIHYCFLLVTALLSALFSRITFSVPLLADSCVHLYAHLSLFLRPHLHFLLSNLSLFSSPNSLSAPLLGPNTLVMYSRVHLFFMALSWGPPASCGPAVCSLSSSHTPSRFFLVLSLSSPLRLGGFVFRHRAALFAPPLVPFRSPCAFLPIFHSRSPLSSMLFLVPPFGVWGLLVCLPLICPAHLRRTAPCMRCPLWLRICAPSLFVLSTSGLPYPSLVLPLAYLLGSSPAFASF